MALILEQPECKLSLLHFNDVYDIQPDPKEPKGGAAYFKSLLDLYRKPHTLTLFSGDVFAPALLSTEFKGENMIKPLNSFKIDCACLGNHDLDFPLQHVKVLKDKTNFPWLCSNIYNKLTGRRIADCQQYKIIEQNGYKIGIFSLAEKQWLDTLFPFYWQILQYVPWQQFTEYILKQLKEEKCNLIIALTHMMKYNDVKLAEKYNEIDLILGGHDHLVVHEKSNNSILVKSGTNFKNFNFIQIFPINQITNLKEKQPKSYEQVFIFNNNKIAVRITLVEVNHEQTKIKPDQQIHEYVQKVYGQFQQKQQWVCCYFSQDVDLRFQCIRRQQNGYLQLITSLYRYVLKSDCAMINSGNFRSNIYIPAGPVPYRILTNIIEDEIVVLKISGDKLYKGLENGVSMYPNLSGRYCTLSGIEFTWDCTKEPQHRILIDTIKINGEPLQLDRIYTMAMHNFIAKGGDGYNSFKSCEVDNQHYEKNNLVFMHDWLDVNQKEWKAYSEKNPGRVILELEENGQKRLVFHLENPKNLTMIGENRQPHIKKIEMGELKLHSHQQQQQVREKNKKESNHSAQQHSQINDNTIKIRQNSLGSSTSINKQKQGPLSSGIEQFHQPN